MKTVDLALPPFNFRIHTNVPLVLDNLTMMYQHQCMPGHSLPYCDYELTLKYSSGIRRWFRPQVRFLSDTYEPFKPLNHSQAYAMLEWGMNWAVAAHEVDYLMLHAGVLAKGNDAVVFPAPPGSGKSTTTAWLSHHGWRLLSDEMTIVDKASLDVTPFCRPVCLKNDSITLAKEWFPHAPMSSVATDTHKGDVIHLRAPIEPKHLKQKATIKAIVFPRYNKSADDLQIMQLNHAQAMHELADNAFNYNVSGLDSWKTLIHIVESVPIYAIDFAQVDQLREFLEYEVLNVTDFA